MLRDTFEAQSMLAPHQIWIVAPYSLGLRNDRSTLGPGAYLFGDSRVGHYVRRQEITISEIGPGGQRVTTSTDRHVSHH
jgi:hypothetical protein